MDGYAVSSDVKFTLQEYFPNNTKPKLVFFCVCVVKPKLNWLPSICGWSTAAQWGLGPSVVYFKQPTHLLQVKDSPAALPSITTRTAVISYLVSVNGPPAIIAYTYCSQASGCLDSDKNYCISFRTVKIGLTKIKHVGEESF